MAKRLAELGALQDAVSNDESSPKRLALAGYIRGLFLDWSANPYNPLSRLTARGRLLGYFWDSGAIGLSMNFADQNYLVKDGTVQSKSFSQIVNFSRTTNATVTNSAGQITYAPHNLLTYSEQFDNAAWTKTTTTVTANAIASPTSTTTGDTLTAGGANSTTLHSYTAIAQPYTFSIYIRRRTGTGVIEITADGSTYVAKTITSAWTRFDTTITPTAGTRTPGVRIVTSGDAIDVWGAQLEIGSTATTYNSTTVKNLLGYSELFDNAAWTKSNSFVQTNLLTYSEAFDNAVWTKINSAVTSNDVVAPNGYQTADKITANAGLGRHQIFEVPAITIANVPYTSSVYLKQGTNRYAYLVFGSNAANSNVWAAVVVDLQTGLITQTSNGAASSSVSSVVSPANNGFYRVSLTQTMSTTDTFVGIYLSDVATPSIAGFGVYSFTATGTETIYAWGAQLVQGSVAGDYRRTDSTSLPVYYPNHNGVVCAEKLVENTATNYHAIYGTTITAGTYMASIYAKAGEKQFLQLAGGASVNDYITFNLALGTITQTGSGATLGSITAAGNGYYRCSARIPLSVSGVFITACSTGTGGWLPSNAGDGTSGIYIFGAQLSDSASLDPYVLNAAAAPTATAYYGARFDYDPVTLAPKGLLIEEQRTNLANYSQTFFAWNVSSANGSLVLDSGNSPDGTVNAYKFVENTTTNTRYQQYNLVGTHTNITYTISFYLKKVSYDTHMIRIWDITNTSYIDAIFNIATGTFVSQTKTGTNITYVGNSVTALANGWYRCALTCTIGATTSTTLVIQDFLNGGASYLGNGTNSTLIWGAQLEAGAFATSYIPTAASQVTRAADVATIQGSNFYSWINQNEGTILASGVTNNTNTSTLPTYLSLSQSTTAQYNIALLNANNVNPIIYLQVDAGTNQAGVTAIGNARGSFNKVGGAYKINDFQFSVNNTLGAGDTSGNIPLVEELKIGRLYTGGQPINGTIKSISYYPQRLSDSVLKGLTA